MKLRINQWGIGQELAVGTVSEEIWDYIQSTFDGDVHAYIDALSEKDVVPEEFRIRECIDAGDRIVFSPEENDDQYHAYGGFLSGTHLVIENDEDSGVVYELECGNAEGLKESGIEVHCVTNTPAPEVRYVSVFKSTEKGSFLCGIFETDGEFDPKKLEIFCENLELNDEETEPIVMRFEYDGEEIECNFDSTTGKSCTVDIIDLKKDED